MKTTYKKIMNDLMPALTQVTEMQARGMLILPAKIGYALGRNISMANPFLKDYEKERQAILEKCVKHDAAGKLATFVNENKEKKWDFKEGGEVMYKEMMEKFLDTEITWSAYRMPKDVLEQVDNFPVQAYGVLEEFEMITDLHLSMAKLPN